MKPEDVPSEYGGDSTETIQLALPEWANAMLTDYSESVYGNTQHKGEFVTNALLLMHKIQQGEGVSPDFLTQIGVDVDAAGWETDYDKSQSKRRFSSNENYLNSLELSDTDRLGIEEFDYGELCSDTYSKRIPVIAAVIRQMEVNYTQSGLEDIAGHIFPAKHEKTVERYADELEQAIIEDTVAGVHRSLAHDFERHSFQNGDFGTTSGETLRETLLDAYEPETVEERFPTAEKMIVTGGQQGLKTHALDITNELYDELERLEAKLESALFPGETMRQALVVFTTLREIDPLLDDLVADHENLDIREGLLRTHVEDASDIINRIR